MGALEFDLQLKTMMYLLLTLSLKLYLEQHYKHFFLCLFDNSLQQFSLQPAICDTLVEQT